MIDRTDLQDRCLRVKEKVGDDTAGSAFTLALVDGLLALLAGDLTQAERTALVRRCTPIFKLDASTARWFAKQAITIFLEDEHRRAAAAAAEQV